MISIIHSEPSQQQRVEHSADPSLSCSLDSLLSFLVMPHLLSKTIGFIDGFLMDPISAMLI